MLSRHRIPRGLRLRHSHGSAALQICRPSTPSPSNEQQLLQPIDPGLPHKRPVVAMAILFPIPPGQVFGAVLTPQALGHPSPHPFTKNVLGHLQLWSFKNNSVLFSSACSLVILTEGEQGEEEKGKCKRKNRKDEKVLCVLCKHLGSTVCWVGFCQQPQSTEKLGL